MEPMAPMEPPMTCTGISPIGSIGPIGLVGSGRDCYGHRYGDQSKLALPDGLDVWRRVA